MSDRFLGRHLGKYRIDALAGAGGFAWVYKAYDPELEIPVALKVLKPHYAGDEKFEGRFRREAAVAARLRHPNIIKIYSVGRDGDAVYFAMDFLPSGLVDRLTVTPTLAEPALIRMGIDVANALGYAHRQGVIHRDIKVDNILFDDHGNAVVADFGIARALAEEVRQTASGMVVGTPQYFAPEQARGLEIDGRADLYSLGITLFRAATGHLPFAGEDWYDIARQHVEEEPPRPRDLTPSVSRELEHIILRLLAKDPADRFRTGEQLASALGDLLQEHSEPTSMRTLVVTPIDSATSPGLSRLPRLRRKARRFAGSRAGRRTLGVVALGAAIAAVAAGAYVSGASSRAAPASVAAPPVPDAPPPAPPTPRALVVEAPAAAEVSVNGVVVGNGAYRNDSIGPGRYDVAATIRALRGCPSAQATRAVEVADTGVATVALEPRPCGTVVLDVSPSDDATFTLRGPGGFSRSGPVTNRPIVLPEGSYRVEIDKPLCTPFSSTERVRAGATPTRVRVRPICGVE